MNKRCIQRVDPSAHTGAHTTHTHTQTYRQGSSQTQEQRRRVAGRGALSGEAWAEPDYSEKAGKAVREWRYWDNRRRGPEWARHPKSRKLREKSLACVSCFTVRR